MIINCYRHKGQILISDEEYSFEKINEKAIDGSGVSMIYALNAIDPGKSRRSFCVTSPSQLFIKEENQELFRKKETEMAFPSWITEAINERRVVSLNTAYPNWEDVLAKSSGGKKVISIAGLGDVGGILCSGLRLLGNPDISQIKIYDRDEEKLIRWELECNAILPPENNLEFPHIIRTTESDIFNCDVFVFTVSIGVPDIGKEDEDVRLVQLSGNSAIIAHYAREARKSGFKGLFAVVSDPVDLLCNVAFMASNKNEQGQTDYLGLAPEQIKGYGLGVMYARAALYSRDIDKYDMFLKEGRAFGPHGQGLLIANSIENYDEGESLYLTDKAATSNREVRAAGFKPYIAPALSSGSLSILATIRGGWHYSANFLGGVYFGCRNREFASGTEIETYQLPQALYKRIADTYQYLEDNVQSLEV